MTARLKNLARTLVKTLLWRSPSLQMEELLKPPSRKDMRALDREFFQKEVSVPCLKVNSEFVNEVRPILKPLLLKIPNLKPYVHEETPKFLLNPIKVQSWDDLDEDIKKKLNDAKVCKNDMAHSTITLNYNNWNADEILRAVLPESLEIARGFSKVGHIIHLNLRDKLLDFKQIIGEVLLDKIPNTKTVVNKTNKIDNTFRNFSMELVCGEDNMITRVKENGALYEFDFSLVYWNPRLCTEHQRVVDSLRPTDVLFDVFCGVGPFAIPAAKKGCKVFANDLNPHSFKWLNRNVVLNKIKEGRIVTSNKDGCDFIAQDVKENLLILSRIDFEGTIHVTMNLPAMALEFIKFFKDLFSEAEVDETKLKKILPKIHVYFFVVGENPEEQARADFTTATGLKFCEDYIYQYVRDVSPLKAMVKISFVPPIEYLLKKSETIGEPEPKRLCTEEAR